MGKKNRVRCAEDYYYCKKELWQSAVTSYKQNTHWFMHTDDSKWKKSKLPPSMINCTGNFEYPLLRHLLHCTCTSHVSNRRHNITIHVYTILNDCVHDTGQVTCSFKKRQLHSINNYYTCIIIHVHVFMYVHVHVFVHVHVGTEEVTTVWPAPFPRECVTSYSNMVQSHIAIPRPISVIY